MNLHDIVDQIWLLEYENADGEFQQYRFRGPREAADQVRNYMDRIENASGNMISDVYVYELNPRELSLSAAILDELHDLYDDYLEDEHDE